MTTRRSFLQGAAALPLGTLLPHADGTSPSSAPAQAVRDYYAELELGTFINAAAPYSSLSGSPMWPEVIEAMEYAMTRPARMSELHDAVGRRIAEIGGSEAAMVTAGATSAITLGTAACLTGSDRDLIHRLPDTSGMKDEVIIQKGHRYSYEHAVRNCGVRLVEVETMADVDQAINDGTAMLMFNYSQQERGRISAEQWVEIGRTRGIPTFCDGATMLPPIDNMHMLVSLDFDLLCFSGGKGLRGPYSAGLLMGRPDLVAAARLNSAPNDDAIGRGMKVAKEELLGTMVAVETTAAFNYDTNLAMKRQWVEAIAAEIDKVPEVETLVHYPKGDNHQPQLRITWDESKIRLTPSEAKQRLREGVPVVEVHALSLTDGNLELTAWVLEADQVEIVGRRIREVLEAAS
jgi:L-seryl-tRNA(Ser) seleniumtransferase